MKRAIDWWEGQCVDRAWNAGLTKYYSNVSSIGYLGYIPRPFDLQLKPLGIEIQRNLYPRRLFVTGSGVKSLINNLSSKTIIDIAPAFRFNHLWDKKHNQNKRINHGVLVALTIDKLESSRILSLLVKLHENFKNPCYKFLVKPHPGLPKSYFGNKFKHNILQNFKFVEGQTSNYLNKTNILITGMSSIALEAIALGKQVIIIENPNGLVHHPIPENLDKSIWCSVKRTLI